MGRNTLRLDLTEEEIEILEEALRDSWQIIIDYGGRRLYPYQKENLSKIEKMLDKLTKIVYNTQVKKRKDY